MHTIVYMHGPSTDTQSFSSFASLNRADQTHPPRESSVSRERITGFVIAGIVVVLAICLAAGTF